MSKCENVKMSKCEYMKRFSIYIVLCTLSLTTLLSSCGVYRKYKSQTEVPDDLYGSGDSIAQIAMADSATIADISWREFFRDPFSLVPIADLTEMADKMTRNEIMTANEIRQVIGMKPSDEPKADKLQNSNLYQENEPTTEETDDLSEEDQQLMVAAYGGLDEEQTESALSDLDDLDSQLDELEALLDEDEVKHYASPYYDPVKAHEYYEEHKHLKGRRSTAGLNDEGKNAAKYIKKQLDEERKEKVQEHKDWTDEAIDISRDNKDTLVDSKRSKTKAAIEALQEKKQEQVEAHKTQTQNEIDSIRDSLKNMSKEQKARARDRLYAKIDSLREANRAERTRLNNDFKQTKTALNAAAKREITGFREDFKTKQTGFRDRHREVKTQLKEAYDKKYESELNKIRSDASFQKPKKTKNK